MNLESRNEVIDAISTHEKAENHFGKYTEVSLNAALKTVWEWAKNTELKQAKRFKNIEIQKRLPENWK